MLIEVTQPSRAAHDIPGIFHRGLLQLLKQWDGVMWPGGVLPGYFILCRSRLNKPTNLLIRRYFNTINISTYIINRRLALCALLIIVVLSRFRLP